MLSLEFVSRENATVHYWSTYHEKELQVEERFDAAMQRRLLHTGHRAIARYLIAISLWVVCLLRPCTAFSTASIPAD